MRHECLHLPLPDPSEDIETQGWDIGEKKQYLKKRSGQMSQARMDTTHSSGRGIGHRHQVHILL
jgi:hypothetical protein